MNLKGPKLAIPFQVNFSVFNFISTFLLSHIWQNYYDVSLLYIFTYSWTVIVFDWWLYLILFVLIRKYTQIYVNIRNNT